MNLRAVCIAILASLALVGCKDESSASLPATQPTRTMGPQFKSYELPEYSLHESDVMSGLWGRWITFRYLLKPKAAISSADIRARI